MIELSDETECQLCLEDEGRVEPIFCHCPTAMGIRYATFAKVDPSLTDLKTISFNMVLSLRA